MGAQEEEQETTIKAGGKKTIFHSGDVAFVSKPFVSVLDREWKFKRCDRCFECFPPGQELPRPVTCLECNAVLYCNESCRESALPDHEDECQYLRQKGKSIISDTGRFMMKLLLKTSRAEKAKKQQTDAKPPAGLREVIPEAGITRTFNQLLSHYQYITKDTERMETVNQIYAELKKYDLKELPEDTDKFVLFCGKVLINSFNYTDEHNKRIGSALYLGASILDHSCAPNATFSFLKGEIIVRCLEDVVVSRAASVAPPHSHLRISYLDLMDSTENRRRRLRTQYYFDCECSRCTDPSLEFALHSMRCQHRECSGRPVYVGMAKDSADLKPGKCENCGFTPSKKLLDFYIEVCTSVSKELDAANNKELDVDETLAVMTGILHPDHRLYTKAAKRAFEKHLRDGNWTVAREYGLLCLNSYRKYKSHVWPAYGQLLLKLGRLELHHLPLLPRPVPQTHLEEAAEVIAVTHGEHHVTYIECLELLEQVKIEVVAFLKAKSLSSS